jgi:glucokinase
MAPKNLFQTSPKKGGGKRFAIGLDGGGTSLKSAIVTSDGSIVGKSFQITPIDSQGSAEIIIGAFIQTLSSNLKFAKNLGFRIEGIGIGMPGPFDYKEGICLIPPELHKFRAIYGLNLKQELTDRLEIKEVRFENDAWTFLRGEAWTGAARGYSRAIGITLGTGLGSAFLVKDKILTHGTGIPPLGWIGGIPYENGIVEGKITLRWISTRYKELSEQKSNLSIKEIARRGKQEGDKASLRTFEEMGERLGKILRPIASKFKVDCIVLGGQISKSFSLFSAPIKRELRSVPTLKKVAAAHSIDLSPVYGATKIIFLGSKYKPQKLVLKKGRKKP